MAIISGTVVNWSVSPRIITIPAPVTNVSIADLQDTLQDLEDDEIGIVFPKLRSTSGNEDLGGGLFVGLTMQLQNAQVQFEGRTTPTETGTCTSDDADGKILVASGGQFVTNSLARGDIVFNSTTASMATIISVESETQLTHQVLSGGSRATWLNTDSYIIYPNVQCTISGGNLVSVDTGGSPIPAILGSANTDTILALSSSSTAIVTGSGVLPSDVTDIANQVWANTLEGAMSAEGMMRIMMAFAANNATGLKGINPEFMNMAGDKARISSTVTEGGTRTTVLDET